MNFFQRKSIYIISIFCPKNDQMMMTLRKIRKMILTNLNSWMNLNSLMNLNFSIRNLKTLRYRKTFLKTNYMRSPGNKRIRFPHFFWKVPSSFAKRICFLLKEQNNCCCLCRNSLYFRLREPCILKVNRTLLWLALPEELFL